ncbi:MAG TPA: hypothetical protein VLA92_05035 [Candidatus Saccharimonadales bacterium]|nr:hypothetical protein [Candidatus Saccharimonadales bacterium]
MPEKVMAAGETFTWVDNNTIKVTGGDLTGHTMKLIPGSNPQRFMISSDESLPVYKGDCSLAYNITLTNDTAATLTSGLPSANAPPIVGEVGAKDPCELWDKQNNKPFFPGVNESYNNKGISIAGKRSGDQTETETEKGVHVTINSPDPASSSPDSIKIFIQDKNGKTVDTVTASQVPALGSADPDEDRYISPDSRPVMFNADFKLEPGEYLVCADIVIQDCKRFTKEKFKMLVLEYGDSSTDRQIKVHLKVTYIGGPKDLTVGPFTVMLNKPGGGLVSIQTGTATHKMTPQEEASQGGGQVSYSLGIDTQFTGLDPATYKICVDGVEECKDVKKVAGEVAEVTFTIDWLAFQENNDIERDCKEKYEVMNVRAITFLVCSVIDTGTYVVGVFDDVIVQMLTIDVNDIFDDSAMSNSYHLAWNSFRIFALGLIVIAALVMVVSQAAGVEILDAYTVRKVLPRLLFAAIFIALSWDILEFLATLSNEAGQGIRTLIYAPFSDITSVGGNIGGGSLFALTLIGTGGALALGWAGLLSFVVTAIIASLTALFVLIVRKIIIIILIIMAPFAIAAGILPNTEKIYSFWKSAMASMLLVFPIIMAFIAIGRVFSAIAFTSPGIQIVNQLIAFIAYFAPYFLITMAFKMAGGLMGKLSGVASQQTKGLSGSMKSFRGKKIQENMGKMASGNRFQDSNPIARKFNSATFNATMMAKSPSKAGLNPLGYITSSGRRQNALLREKMREQQRMMNAAKFAGTARAKVGMHNDMMQRALLYANASQAAANLGTDFGMSEEQVKDAIAAARANGGFGRDQQIYAVQRLFGTGTGFNDLPQAIKAIHQVAGDNTELAMSLIGEGNAVSGGVGRLDLKIGFGTYAGLYNKLQTTGELTETDIDDAYMQAVEGNDVNEVVRGKPKATQNLAPVIARRIAELRNVAENPHAGFDDQGRALNEIAAYEVGRLTGIIEKYNSTSNRWASPAIKSALHHDENGVMAQTEGVRAGVQRDIQSGDQNAARGYNQQRPPF